jgi:uncharacterized protein
VTDFATRYGPWALIAGASEGIGAAYAQALAERGLCLVLVARRPGPLQALAARLPCATRIIATDLATAEGVEQVITQTADLRIGLVVANAADAPLGAFVSADPQRLARAIDLNCRTPVLLARHFLPPMAARRRGGLIIMSSLAGQQGSPGLATYAASKAFGAVLAEGLWAELAPHGVDVLTCVPGAVSKSGMAHVSGGAAPGTVSPDVVVGAALRALGRRPRTVPGALMRVSSSVMARVLPRRTAINAIGRASRAVVPPPSS